MHNESVDKTSPIREPFHGEYFDFGCSLNSLGNCRNMIEYETRSSIPIVILIGMGEQT